MFRIFSYLADEPEHVAANAKEQELLETTGYNKEAIDGLKQLIRDKDAQLQSIESQYQQQMEQWKAQWIAKQLEAQDTLTAPTTHFPPISGPSSEEYESLQSSLTQEKQAHSQTIITLQQTQQQVTTLQQQLDMLQGQGLHVSHSPPASARNSRVAELESEILSLKQSLQHTQSQAEQAAREAIHAANITTNDHDEQQHIAHLQSQLDAQQQHIQHLDSLIAQHEMSGQSWQQREHQYQQELTSMRHELEQAKHTLTEQTQQQHPSTPAEDPQLLATLQQQQQIIESLQAQLQQKTLNEQQTHAKVSQKLDQVKGMLSRKDAHIESLKQQLIAANLTPAPPPNPNPNPAPVPASAPASAHPTKVS